MPHTQSRYQADLGFADGVLNYSMHTIIPTGSAAAITRNGVGDFSLNIGAAVTTVFSANLLEGQLYRTGVGEDLMQQFGGSQPAGASAIQGRPDTFGAMNTAQQLQPRTANKNKGLKLVGIAVKYFISGAALTGHTCRLDKSVYANNVALAVTNSIASAANGLATATQANPYVTVIAVPAAANIYYTTDLTELWFEVSATTQAGGAYRFYGVRGLWEFNYN